MTKTIRFGVAGIAMFAAMGMSSVAHADTATADARAEVLQALQLDLVDGSLDFGAIVLSGNGAETLTLQPNGTMDCANKEVTCSGTTDVPEFQVQGTADKDVTISFSTTSIDLARNGGTGTGADVMTVDTFTTNATGNEVTLTGGSANFTVGGTLNIGVTQNAGVYEGDFTVQVDYS